MGLAKELADLNAIKGVSLWLIMFTMNATNTPNIAPVLTANSMAFIPEAHCVLRIDNHYIDLTTATSTFLNIENDIMERKEISLSFLRTEKEQYHKKYIKQWAANTGSTKPLNVIWSIREACIELLSQT